MSTTKEREMLELSAKAAGYRISWTKRFTGEWGFDLHYNRAGDRCRWNPLTNDGDAFRLAVKLEIGIQHHHHGIGWVDVFVSGHATVKELIGTDPTAATRLAITRLAAEIGRSKHE